MFETITDIKKAVRDSEGDQDALRVRMQEHLEYAVGVEYQTAKGYEQYTSPAPQTFVEKLTDGLNRAEMTLQIKLPEDAKKRERESASLNELFLFGALNDIDRNLRRRGEKPLREGLGYYINVRGWYTLKCVVYVRKGEVYFDVQPWDPAHVAYDYGSFGLLWIARTRRSNAGAIKAEYDIDIRGDDAEVIDFWDTERNSVIIQNSWAKRPTAHDLPEIPILHGSVGPMPSMEDKDSLPMLEYRGHSVFHSAIHTFEPKNRFTSQLMDMHKKSIVGSIKHYSKGGTKKLAGDPHAEYMEIQLDSSADEDVRMLELPMLPEVTAALLGIFDTDQQQSMLPYPLAYGGTEQRLSGRAIAHLADAQGSVYSPRTGALIECMTWLSEQCMGQFAQKGIPTDFRGYNAEGRYFSVKVKPTQVKKGWYIAIDIRPKLPRDLESDIQTAVQATADNGTGALMSKQTAREDIIKMRNPDAENNRVLAEKGMNLEPVAIQQVAAALERAGETEMSRQVLAWWDQQQQAAAPGPGATGEATQPPQQLPPEMVEAIAQVFIQADQQELGLAVLELLGVPLPGSGQPAPNGTATAPVG